ncbi:beta-lactamase [Streptomyces sp. CNQ-509]|uniref:serine hydrolase domain-containing protein n=1 Tax=unclassified Streptomyces TaxID=2593676 RepID=UPI00062DDF8A|nr:serine hydrolase domain-containing protein [Streptomyces sp. CNQ-509]AKH85115.1 beta-lactamase [Streptomyces sp. CNQ-509]
MTTYGDIRARRLLAALLVLLVLPAAAACGADRDRDRDVRDDGAAGIRTQARAGDPATRAVEKYLDEVWPEDAPGTVVAARGGAAVTCSGRGPADPGTGARAGCGTVYDIASMTKQFTAAAIVKLQTEGKLRVTDPLSRHLDGVPADKRGITLHHLLTHTAGLPESLGDDYDPLSRAGLVSGALATPLHSPPGERYAYSNTGYSLLAAVVEEASGTGYEPYLAGHLFRPAGMTDTGYVLPDWDRDRIAVEYDRRGRPQGRPMDHPWAGDGPYWNLRGNGGMLSTARDMLRWHRALLGDRVLPAKARKLLFTRYVPEGGGAGSFYGYGWSLLDLGGAPVATHDGGNEWSSGRVARFLDDGTLVFWISNAATRAGAWDLPDLDRELTTGIAERVRERA